jgi:hypothetical protein
MSTETIHTALLGIARGGDDSIPLADDLSLVRTNDQLLAHRWNWAQGQGEVEEEAEATRYLVCEYPQWAPGEGWGVARCWERPAVVQCVRSILVNFLHGFLELRMLPVELGPFHGALCRSCWHVLHAEVPEFFSRAHAWRKGVRDQR